MSGKNIGVGIALGFPFGAVLGMLRFDNIALGVALGPAIGVAIGAATGADKTDPQSRAQRSNR